MKSFVLQTHRFDDRIEFPIQDIKRFPPGMICQRRHQLEIRQQQIR
jgi:hypothetical protein